MQKIKICKKCQRYEGEINKREEILGGVPAGTMGYVSMQILADKYTKLLAEHRRAAHFDVAS